MINPLIIAHRGGKALGPENTLDAMLKSIKAGAEGIEFDVQVTINDEPVVIHDATLDRTTDRRGEVSKLSLREIQACNTEQGQKVPSLRQVLHKLTTSNVRLFIEIKHPKAAMPTAKMVEHYIGEYPKGHLVVISSLHQVLAQIHTAYPNMTLGAIMKQPTDALAACAEFTHSRYILPSIDILTKELVEDAQKRKVKVIPWVCDSKEQITHATALGVDGIMTSDPSLMAKG